MLIRTPINFLMNLTLGYFFQKTCDLQTFKNEISDIGMGSDEIYYREHRKKNNYGRKKMSIKQVRIFFIRSEGVKILNMGGGG